MDPNFDRIVIIRGSERRSLTPAQFFVLPLTERLRAIFEKRLEFYRGSERVETMLALQSLREVAAHRGERR